MLALVVVFPLKLSHFGSGCANIFWKSIFGILTATGDNCPVHGHGEKKSSTVPREERKTTSKQTKNTRGKKDDR